MQSEIIRDAAMSYWRSGLSVLPANKTKKYPAIGAWKTWSQRLPNELEVETWFSNTHDALALVTGAVSGNLECIDFDNHGELYEAWKVKIDQNVFASLVTERTQSNGVHVFYRCEAPIDGNHKLARGVRDGKPVTLIETRGEGGLALCAPSDGYTLLQGSFDKLPVLSADARQGLLETARALDEMSLAPTVPSVPTGVTDAFALKPGDDFNARGEIRSILAAHGWTSRGMSPDGNEAWVRPDKDPRDGLSAHLKDGVFYVFSTNADPFEGGKGYSFFQVYALLEHNGDFAAAANALLAQGYGKAIDPCEGVDITGLLASLDDSSKGTAKKENALGAMNLPDLVAQHPSLRPILIDDFLRIGETMNIIAPPKTGKSWLVMDLALSVATGRDWFGHSCTTGKVLMIDNELHPETSANRIPKVIAARGIGLDEVGDNLAVANQRGRLMTIADLGNCLQECQNAGYKLIVIDAFYRAMPEGVDENDNGAITGVYNMVDRYAQKIGCAFVLVHHTSKGNQSQKSVTDVGAGAGSQSRAADTHVIMRRHKEDGVVVLDSVVRSFKSTSPICLRWSWPVWNVDSSCNPADLDGVRLSQQKREATDDDLVAPLVDYFVRVKKDEPMRTSKFLRIAQAEFASAATKEIVKAALEEAIERGHLVSERMANARKGQQSTRYLSLGDEPITETEREVAFLAGFVS